jgi:chemotaxis response regulator CheB
MSSDSTSLSNSGQPPLRVLLIEDSALIRRSLVEAIDASGVLHVVAYADSSDEAIALR